MAATEPKVGLVAWSLPTFTPAGPRRLRLSALAAFLVRRVGVEESTIEVRQQAISRLAAFCAV